MGTASMASCEFQPPTTAYDPDAVFPPWRDIYETDQERRQDWAEAERTSDVILTLLPTLGYEPIVVPIGSLAERAAFVLARAG